MVHPEQKFEISLEISNVGSAPFYYKWPIEISFLNQERVPVFHKIIDGIDITSWMPDETFTTSVNIDLPKDIKNGTYIVTVAILDPSGNKPSVCKYELLPWRTYASWSHWCRSRA